MEILYPLPALSGADSASDSSVTVLANHTVAWERRGAFLDTLKPLLENFNAFPGALGCKVFEQHEGSLARITILQRFAAVADHEAWLRSADFRRWRDAVSLIQPTVEHVRTYSGIEALFAAGKVPRRSAAMENGRRPLLRGLPSLARAFRLVRQGPCQYFSSRRSLDHDPPHGRSHDLCHGSHLHRRLRPLAATLPPLKVIRPPLFLDFSPSVV